MLFLSLHFSIALFQFSPPLALVCLKLALESNDPIFQMIHLIQQRAAQLGAAVNFGLQFALRLHRLLLKFFDGGEIPLLSRCQLIVAVGQSLLQFMQLRIECVPIVGGGRCPELLQLRTQHPMLILCPA